MNEYTERLEKIEAELKRWLPDKTLTNHKLVNGPLYGKKNYFPELGKK